MNNAIHFTDIEELALHRSFGELTPEEQAAVLIHLGSAGAYDNLRSTLLHAREELALEQVRLEPRAATRTALLQAMQARQKSRSEPVTARLTKILTYRLPAYQLAAAVVVAIAAVLLLGRAPEPGVQQAPPQIVYIEAKEPTVQIDREELIQRVVDSLKEDISRELRSEATTRRTHRRITHRDTVRDVRPVAAGQSEVDIRQGNVFIGLGNLRQLDAQKKGRTLAEDSSLSKFMTPVHDERM